VFSGDLVYRDEEGDLFFVGRRDGLIKTLGYRVSPDEVVDVLCASGEVVEAVVASEPDDRIGDRIVACDSPPTVPLGREQARDLEGVFERTALGVGSSISGALTASPSNAANLFRTIRAERFWATLQAEVLDRQHLEDPRGRGRRRHRLRELLQLPPPPWRARLADNRGAIRRHPVPRSRLEHVASLAASRPFSPSCSRHESHLARGRSLSPFDTGTGARRVGARTGDSRLGEGRPPGPTGPRSRRLRDGRGDRARRTGRGPPHRTGATGRLVP
jgi:hypothetical protein